MLNRKTDISKALTKIRSIEKTLGLKTGSRWENDTILPSAGHNECTFETN